MDHLDQLAEAIADERKQVIAHPIYSALGGGLPAVRTFMEHHVWAVWDFMSLLKSLQINLTCTTIPWVPWGDPRTRRLVNEIVLAEESDVGAMPAQLPAEGWSAEDAMPLSHLELYLNAMDEAGADTDAVRLFLADLGSGRQAVLAAMDDAGAPRAAQRFTTQTWHLATIYPLHAQAAAFAFGREDLIPEMFDQVRPLGVPLFADYLARHIELDAEHGRMARAMVSQLCRNDERRWAEATDAARTALRARRKLWDAAYAAMAD